MVHTFVSFPAFSVALTEIVQSIAKLEHQKGSKTWTNNKLISGLVVHLQVPGQGAFEVWSSHGVAIRSLRARPKYKVSFTGCQAQLQIVRSLGAIGRPCVPPQVGHAFRSR